MCSMLLPRNLTRGHVGFLSLLRPLSHPPLLLPVHSSREHNNVPSVRHPGCSNDRLCSGRRPPSLAWSGRIHWETHGKVDRHRPLSSTPSLIAIKVHILAASPCDAVPQQTLLAAPS